MRINSRNNYTTNNTLFFININLLYIKFLFIDINRNIIKIILN